MSLFSKGVVISLCDLTGNFTKPWRDAGFRALHIDPQRKDSGTILEMGNQLAKTLKYEKIIFVAGFPPCTDVSVSGARWFAAKRLKDKHFQSKAALIAEQCRMIGILSGAPWFFENPVSVFSSIFGKPNHTFDPYEYTGFCGDDNYYKKTCLWSGGGFRMPYPNRDTSLGIPDDRIHKQGPSDERANIRSATPLGFARAVYEANKPAC